MFVAFALLVFAAASSKAVQPTGPWVIRPEENRCMLQAQYKDDDTSSIVLFQPVFGRETVYMTIIEPNTSKRQVDGKFKANLLNAKESHEGTHYSIAPTGSEHRTTRLSLSEKFFAKITDGETISFKAWPISRSFVLNGIASARADLDKCMDRLVRSWGVEPNTPLLTTEHLEGDIVSFFSTDDYPVEAVNERISGRVTFLLNVSSAGAVTGCHIISSAGTSLNAGTCRAASRMRFKTTRDSSGAGQPAAFVTTVSWVMPREY